MMSLAMHSSIPLLLTVLHTSLVSQRRLPSIQDVERETTEESSANNIAQRHGDTARPDEFSDVEVGAVEHANRDEEVIGDAMLVAHSYESPDGNPNAVDLGRVVAAGCAEEEGQADEPIAADAAREVVCPVDVDAAFGTSDGVS